MFYSSASICIKAPTFKLHYIWFHKFTDMKHTSWCFSACQINTRSRTIFNCVKKTKIVARQNHLCSAIAVIFSIRGSFIAYFNRKWNFVFTTSRNKCLFWLHHRKMWQNWQKNVILVIIRLLVILVLEKLCW